VEEARTRGVEGIAAELEAGARRGVARLVSLVDDDSAPPSVQLNAAKALLGLALHYRDAATYESRISAIEAMLYGSSDETEARS
jgi:hypothetical protein